MRRLTTLLLGMFLGGGCVYGAYQYHLVRTGDQFLLIPKGRVSLIDPYVDVREWDLDDWEKHPEVLEAMKSQGHADLLPTDRSGDNGDLQDASRTDPTVETRSADHLPSTPRNSRSDDATSQRQ
ncbi:MAG: hypothetical protein CMJ65_03555 [Planctomycetaceae bacterium]|jgi:hypothetical protein|nr:hypothetical protein [Planctomycetaceae bacterium]MDP7274662.1 hypothetical protein [Planctomycetaceae bacterium]